LKGQINLFNSLRLECVYPMILKPPAGKTLGLKARHRQKSRLGAGAFLGASLSGRGRRSPWPVGGRPPQRFAGVSESADAFSGLAISASTLTSAFATVLRPLRVSYSTHALLKRRRHVVFTIASPVKVATLHWASAAK
jgi:hypothetical protein